MYDNVEVFRQSSESFFSTRFRAVFEFPRDEVRTSRCAVSSSCLLVLASPVCAGGGIDRAQSASRGAFFFLFCNLFVSTSQVSTQCYVKIHSTSLSPGKR